MGSLPLPAVRGGSSCARQPADGGGGGGGMSASCLGGIGMSLVSQLLGVGYVLTMELVE